LQKIYRRVKKFTKYKLLQQYYFMEFLIDKGWIEFSKDKKTIIFKPLFIEIDKDHPLSINPPFIEFNPIRKSYEIAEGHSRLWICHHIYGVEHIRTLVVKDIDDHFFTIKNKALYEAENLDEFCHWDQTISLIETDENHILDSILEPRDIEQLSHGFDLEGRKKMMEGFFNELVKIGILESEDRKYHYYLK